MTSKEIIQSLDCKKAENLIEFSENFKKCFQDIYLANSISYSTFIINKYSSHDVHPLYVKLLEMQEVLSNKKGIPPVKLIKNIEDSLAVFFLGNCSFLNSLEYQSLLKNLILFREGANFLGWEYVEIYKKFNILPNIVYDGDYSMLFKSEDIPLIADDYLRGFLNFDSNFPLNKADVVLFIIDFCNFLFETDQTNYKLEPLNN